MELIFILYKPAVPGNVGAAARAIKTMGFRELRLIDPCDHLSTEAVMLAHGSADILENAKVYGDFSMAVEGIDFIIGTTAKSRNSRVDYLHPGKLFQLLQSKSGGIKTAALVFGTEESGLPNEILASCDVATSIPMDQAYPSLNLGQAVMLYAWELSGYKQFALDKKIITDKPVYEELKRRVKELLPEIGIPAEMPLHNRILERLAMLGENDIRLLHSISSRIKDKL